LRDELGIHRFLQGQQTYPEGQSKIPFFGEGRQGFWGLGRRYRYRYRDGDSSDSGAIELRTVLGNVLDIDLMEVEAPFIVSELFLLFVHKLGECLCGLYFDMRHSTSGGSV
jgi:hypothetical protein